MVLMLGLSLVVVLVFCFSLVIMSVVNHSVEETRTQLTRMRLVLVRLCLNVPSLVYVQRYLNKRLIKLDVKLLLLQVTT